MRFPNPSSICGRLLAVMIDGKPRTKIELAHAIGENEYKEVTARVRDLRNLYDIPVPPRETEKRSGEAPSVYVYRVAGLSAAERNAVRLQHLMYRAGGRMNWRQMKKAMGLPGIDVFLAVEQLESKGAVKELGAKPCPNTGLYFPKWELSGVRGMAEDAAA